MNWMKLTKHNLPPQGLKILAFKNGDCWTCYRFTNGDGSIWIPCLPSFSQEDVKKFRTPFCNEPEYWSYIAFDDLPGEYTGLMKITVANAEVQLTFDEIEKQFPATHKLFIENLITSIEKELEK